MEESREYVREKVREVLESCDWNRGEAVQKCKVELAADPDARDAILALTMEQAVRTWVDEVCRRQNRAVVHFAPIPEKGESGEMMSGGGDVSALARRWETWTLPIPGAPRLIDATKDQLLEAVALHEKNAAGHLLKARFYGIVARRTTKGRTVGQALKPERLTQLWKEAEGEAAAS